MAGMEMSADDRVFELVAMTAIRQRRERWFAPEVPTDPPGEGPGGGGTEQGPSGS